MCERARRANARRARSERPTPQPRIPRWSRSCGRASCCAGQGAHPRDRADAWTRWLPPPDRRASSRRSPAPSSARRSPAPARGSAAPRRPRWGEVAVAAVAVRRRRRPPPAGQPVDLDDLDRIDRLQRLGASRTTSGSTLSSASLVCSEIWSDDSRFAASLTARWPAASTSKRTRSASARSLSASASPSAPRRAASARSAAACFSASAWTLTAIACALGLLGRLDQLDPLVALGDLGLARGRDLFLGGDRLGARRVGLGLGLAFLAALVLDRDLLLLAGDLDRLDLGDLGLLDRAVGLDLLRCRSAAWRRSAPARPRAGARPARARPRRSARRGASRPRAPARAGRTRCRGAISKDCAARPRDSWSRSGRGCPARCRCAPSCAARSAR